MSLLTKPQVAALLQVSVRTVERLERAGDLQAVRLGVAVRYDEADVHALVERRKQPGAAARRLRPVPVEDSFSDRLRSLGGERAAS